jgi:hypothetical protein
VEVSAASPTGVRSLATGGYTLAATFPDSPIASDPTLASGTLAGTQDTAYETLNVPNAEVFHFDLSLNAGASADTAVSVTVFDASGKAVDYLHAVGKGGSSAGDVVLPAGRYVVRILGADRKGVALPSVSYTLQGTNRSDPIGPSLVDTTLAPVGAPDDGSSATDTTDFSFGPFDLSFVFSLSSSICMTLTDPFSDIVWD